MLASIPYWLPALFLLLVFVGYRQSLPRTVKPRTVFAVALAMFVLSFYGVLSAFGLDPLALSQWLLCYTAAVAIGARYFFPRGLAAVGASVRIPGSWLPLVLLITIFAAKFVLGFAAAVGSPVLHEAWFIAGISGVLGASSGGFAARAVAVRRCAAAVRPAARLAREAQGAA
jgi:hypothetical protein